MSIRDVTPYNMSTGRTDPEIDQDLSPIYEKISKQRQKRLSWENIILPISKKLLWSVIKEPGKTFFKVSFCAGAGYIIYLLTRGTFAGIAVDNDSNFANVFSSDKETRLQEGLNLTNADQAGQFMIDGLATGYVTFNLVLLEHYNKVAGEVINECYKKHIIKLLTSINENTIRNPDENEGNENRNYVIKCKEEVNRLYERLKEDLKPYGEKPIFSKKIVFIPPQQNEEVMAESV